MNFKIGSKKVYRVKNHRLKLPIYLLFFTISPLAVQKFLLDTLIAKKITTPANPLPCCMSGKWNFLVIGC
jgi:hypothetical protein